MTNVCVANAKEDAMSRFDEVYDRSLSDPEGFWTEAAEAIHWEKKWDKKNIDSTWNTNKHCDNWKVGTWQSTGRRPNQTSLGARVNRKEARKAKQEKYYADQAKKLNEETEKEIAKMNAEAETEIQKLVEKTQADIDQMEKKQGSHM